MFKLVSKFKPSGDQPEAIASLVEGINKGNKHQVLLGATGTGKTFTIANVIKEVNKPTLVLAHNKTLAGQLYSEFKELFPENRVEYFVSYYDYYQPEAYVPSTDTYIEKDSSINDEIDELRHSATSALISRRDVIVVASVSCIYGIGEVEDYKNKMLTLNVGDIIDREEVLHKLIDMLYERNEIDLKRGTFRSKGDSIEIIPSNEHTNGVLIEFFGDEIDRISEFETVTGHILKNKKTISIFPASHFVTNDDKLKISIKRIKEEFHRHCNGRAGPHQRRYHQSGPGPAQWQQRLCGASRTIGGGPRYPGLPRLGHAGKQPPSGQRSGHLRGHRKCPGNSAHHGFPLPGRAIWPSGHPLFPARSPP